MVRKQQCQYPQCLRIVSSTFSRSNFALMASFGHQADTVSRLQNLLYRILNRRPNRTLFRIYCRSNIDMQNTIIRVLRISCLIVTALFVAAPKGAFASEPYLAFSDLISGPDTGIGDNLGSGVIVTVWGQHLGDTQGSSKIYYTDSQGTRREAAHVYYWKRANGVLPSGPANLYKSHKMHEVAFSIPDSENGLGAIEIVVGGKSASLPFTVRPGAIYHVKSSGNDSANGSYTSPWLTVDKADATASAGSTIYIHDVNTGDNTTNRAIYWNNASATSSLAAQFGIVSYPGFHPTVMGQIGVSAYRTRAMVTSKLDIYASNYTSVDTNGQHSGSQISSTPSTSGVWTTADGRTVANRIGDIPGGCASSTAGAIAGHATYDDYVSNHKIYGNEIYDYGCNSSSHLHHTTYMSIRSNGADLQVLPWEFGYNYLHGNKAKYGIHQFDQDQGGGSANTCGDLTDTLRIHNNVIVDQAGPGINVASACGWTMDAVIENNVLINVGLPANWDGRDPDTAEFNATSGISIGDSGSSGMFGTMYVRNNLVYNWNKDNVANGGSGCLSYYGADGDNVSAIWTNNICYTTHDQPFIGSGYRSESKLDNSIGSNNIWYDVTGTIGNDAVPAELTNSIRLDPMLRFDGVRVSIDRSSPAVGSGAGTAMPRDIYGRVRGSNFSIGPVEYVGSPANPPSSIRCISGCE